MKTILIATSLLVLLFTSSSQAQISSNVSPSPTPTPETATVSSVKANIREEGNKTSRVIETVNKGTKLIILDADENGTWFQVETEKNIGWVNGSLIKLDDAEKERIRREPKPRTTTRAATGGSSPFREVYTGGSDAEIDITNDSYKDMNLRFGGVNYRIKAGTSRTINVGGGNYQYYASAPGVRPIGGVKTFNTGRRYSWRFYIVTTPRFY
jgi:uncharacterized protein YgiM (DUF1202 family)